MRILDKTGSGNLDKLAQVSDSIIYEMKKSKIISTAFSNFAVNFPQYVIHFDNDIAAKNGVDVKNAMSTLQTYIGSYYASNFIRFGLMYKVMLQSLPEYRESPEDILEMYVKNERGEMVSFSNFVTLERTFGPEQITRYNMYNSSMINGDGAEGQSSGAVIAETERILKEVLPRGYDYEWSGMTREEILAGNQTLYIFAICLIFVYLLLAAQYESFLLPLAVILSLPTGIFGAYFFLYLVGLSNNIYAQVALVMLVGLLGKNAILIVEYSKLSIEEGKSVLNATIEGAIARLRPILMTSFAFIAGLIPLALASGAGAIGNQSIGVTAIGGMLVGTLFGVLVIPGLFYLFASLAYRKKIVNNKNVNLSRKLD